MMQSIEEKRQYHKEYMRKVRARKLEQLGPNSPEAKRAIENQQINQLYLQGNTVVNIALLLNIHKSSVWRRLQKANTPMRKSYPNNDYQVKKCSECKQRENNPNWKDNAVSPNTGRQRANRWFACPDGKERHHIDGNPLNNSPENIMLVTPREHRLLDGRLAKFIQNQPIASSNGRQHIRDNYERRHQL